MNLTHYAESRSNIEKVLLEKIEIGLRKYIPDAIVHQLRIGNIRPLDFTDRLGNEFAIELRGFILGEDLGEIMVKYPEDWWEAFKERWFTKGLLKKYPVKYKTFRARQKVAYPNLKMPTIKDETQLYFLQGS